MYKKVETDPRYMLKNGTICIPVATLADEYGGRCQIDIDDHCYVLRLMTEDGSYKITPYIFREAFEVLKTLPSPQVELSENIRRIGGFDTEIVDKDTFKLISKF